MSEDCKAVGRPRVHDRMEVGRQLYERMATGMLVKDACAELGVLPTKVSEWAASDSGFREVYARAREAQAHALAEQALSIATADDPLTQEREEAIDQAATALQDAGDQQWRQKVKALENNLIQRDRLRVDTIKWLASKIAPRHYGDKQTIEHQGETGLVIRVVKE